ncbi:MAG: hypothetical protein Q4G64_10695 [bacterium]|nr:hypothetical protein [bacterium]
MSPHLVPLPPELQQRVFTLAQAAAVGISERDLRRRGDVTSVGWGLYASADFTTTPGMIAGAIARRHPEAWVSHGSAANVLGIELLDGFEEARPQLTVASAREVIRSRGVLCHRDGFVGRGIGTFSGVRVSSPERIWMELSSSLSQRRAVMLGDHLVRVPRHGIEGRDAAFADLVSLLALLDEVDEALRTPPPRTATSAEWEGRRARVASLRAAAGLIRVGADSPPETALRLAILHAGLPEPSLQYALRSGNRIVCTADLAYEDAKIAIHYDGSPHLSREGHSKDLTRDNTFSSAGWINIRVGANDYREGFRTVIALLGKLLAARGTRAG